MPSLEQEAHKILLTEYVSPTATKIIKALKVAIVYIERNSSKDGYDFGDNIVKKIDIARDLASEYGDSLQMER